MDPFLFRAVMTIIESVRFLRTSHFARQSWQAIYEQDQFTPQSWMMQFAQACHILDIDWCSPFGISLLQAPEVSFLEFSLTDLKRILKSVAAHKCYSITSLMPRKDIHKAQGFLDLSLTLSAKKKMLSIPNEKFSFSFHWESAVTGCTLTADRLAASGLIESAQRRFCGAAKESASHFVEECTALPADLLQPSTCFFFGPNFAQLGIIEIPFEDIRAKLQVSQPSELQVHAWGAQVPAVKHVWTDGSVQLSNHPWLTVASFAVVGEDEQLLSAGVVRHWRLSSYSAELWAILAAFAVADSPTVVHTDSLTVVNQFNDLLRQGVVQIDWTHSNWWGFLHALIHQRSCFCECPLQLVWCPSHLLEHIPAECVTDAEAAAVGSSARDIILNRLADRYAKQQIHTLAGKIKAEMQVKEADVSARQLWLAKLNRVCRKPEGPAAPEVVAMRTPPPRIPLRQQCPRWPWDVPVDQYPWHFPNDAQMSYSSTKALTEVNFRTFLQFSNTLKWRVGDGLACSVFELAVLAFHQGSRFVLPAGTVCTVQAYAAIVRAAITYCKGRQIAIAPSLLQKGTNATARPSPKVPFLALKPF